MTTEKRVLVYHDTTTLASRARKPAVGETIGYRAIADFDPEVNKTFDVVIDLSTEQKNLNLPDSKQAVKKGKGNDI